MSTTRQVIKAAKYNQFEELKQLMKNMRYNTLFMDHAQIDDKYIGVIIEYIKYNDKIQFIELFDNLLTDIGIFNIINALKTNSISITLLNLSRNRITSIGIKYIAEALQNNSILITELYLSSNSITDEGIEYLSESLKTNTTLKTLNLSFNLIGDDGVYSLFEALKHNSTLTILDLTKNCMTDIGVNYILDYLKHNYNLTYLDISINDVNNSKKLQNNVYCIVNMNRYNSPIKNMLLQERCYKIIKDCNIECPESYKKLYN